MHTYVHARNEALKVAEPHAIRKSKTHLLAQRIVRIFIQYVAVVLFRFVFRMIWAVIAPNIHIMHRHRQQRCTGFNAQSGVPMSIIPARNWM